MNLKNIMMWGVIVLLVVGLFQLFQNPKQSTVSDKIPFSSFLKNLDDGRVVQVEIKGNNIEGVLSDGTTFNTYAPNDPNLVEKLASKNVKITALPQDDNMPSLLGVLLSWFPMLLLIGVWIFFMRQMQGGKGGAMGHRHHSPQSRLVGLAQAPKGLPGAVQLAHHCRPRIKQT